jgi:acyl carrier protein
MNDPLVAEIIALIARTQFIAPESISLESTFEELGIDSLSGLAIISEIEKTYQVSIPNEEALMLRNVRQTVECLRGLMPSVRAVAIGEAR